MFSCLSNVIFADSVLVTVDVVTSTSDYLSSPFVLQFVDVGSKKWMFDKGRGFAYNGSSATGVYLEFTFTGTSVELIGCTDKNTGNIDIYLDGSPAPGTANGKVEVPRTTGLVMNQTLYQAENLEIKEHTLKVTVREDYPANNNYFELQKIRYSGLKSEQDQIEDAISSLSWNDIRGNNTCENEVWTDLNLRVILEDGVEADWSTAPAGYINDQTGEIIKREPTRDQRICLKGVFSKNGASAEKYFYFTLLRDQEIFMSPETGFYNLDGEKIAVANASDPFLFKTTIENHTDKEQELILLAGIYNQQGIMIRTQIEQIPLLESAKKDAVLSIDGINKEETVKVYCWQNGNQQPVCKASMIRSSDESIYVSPEGNDKNDGSIMYPFQTVYQATLAAKNALAENPNRAITVFFRQGTYYMDRPIEWTAGDGPSDSGLVTYRAYENEQAVFSGAIQFGKLDWEQYDGSIMVSDIGVGYDFDVLYADSKRQVVARYPNQTTTDTILGYRGDATDVLSPQRIKAKWETTPQDGYVRALHDKKWGGNSYKITGVDSEGNVSLQWVGDNNRGSEYDPAQMIVENIFEELDAPGEWYYDKNSGMLYFYPPEELALSEAVFEGASASEFIRLTGADPERPVQNIAFDGLHFTKTHRTLFNSTYERPLRGDWGLARTGSIFMENAKNVAITNCQFDEIGGNAVMMSGYNEAHCIDQSRMTQIGASAVLIVGKEDAVRDPSHWDGSDHKATVNDTATGPKSEDYPRDITVSNNYMYDLGLYEKQVSGVCMSISSRIHVKGNTIHRCPRAGINISDGTFGGHLIEDNDIFDCVRGTSDHGPINAWGRDRFWSLGGYNTSGSKGEEKAPYAFLDAVETNRIHHNRISHSAGAFGVDLDDGSSNYEISDNLFLGTGVKLREGFGRTVRNNIIVNSTVSIHVSYANNQDLIENNVIVSGQPYSFISPNAGSETVFNKNVFYYGGKAIDVKSSGLSVDKTYIEADPLITNPKLHDYTLKSGSPALKAGFQNIVMNAFGLKGSPVPPPQDLNYEIVDDSDEEDILGGRICSIYSEEIISATGLGDTKGVYIVKPLSVTYTGPEELHANDVIRVMNGTPVENKADFLNRYRQLSEGTQVTVQVYRDQKIYERSVAWTK